MFCQILASLQSTQITKLMSGYLETELKEILFIQMLVFLLLLTILFKKKKGLEFIEFMSKNNCLLKNINGEGKERNFLLMCL